MQSSPASLRRTIFHLAWPVILANFLQTFTTTVDIFMVGRLGPIAVAALGLGSQILFLAFSSVIALSAGTVAVVARHIGAGEPEVSGHALKESLLIGVLLSIPVTLLGMGFSEPILRIFRPEEAVVEAGSIYVGTVFLGMPFLFLSFLSAAALRGAGDTKTPLYVGGVVNVVNFVVNYTLIFGNFGFPALGVQGAAVGTATSYAVGFLLYLNLFIGGRRVLRLRAPGKLLDGEMIRRILRIGYPAALEQVVLQIGFTVWIFFIVGFGTSALAAHQIGARIQFLIFLPGLGYAMAATTLVGQNLGANDPLQAERSGREAVKLAVLTTGALSVITFVLAEHLARLFIEDEGVVTLAATWIRLYSIGIPAFGLFFTTGGALRGAGDTKWPLYTSATGLLAIRLPLSYVLGYLTPLALIGVWISMVVEYYVRSVVITLRFRSGAWKGISV
ncbi:MAG: MATE family efflux transporter [Thermoplasmata archaeon]